jgi:hypothetical protein
MLLTIRHNEKISRWLKESAFIFIFLVSLSSFIVYTCMYGFRKPYTVGLYQDYFFLGISYKVCLVIAQVLGYMCSKFLGIRVIATMKPQNRIQYILYCILIAWFSLFLFAIIPAPYNILCLFLNGLPLGLIFGLVFGFLEGRTTTEILGAFLATSFIFASGLAKSVGKWLLISCNVNEQWMPFLAGLLFIFPLLFALWILKQTPPPNVEDVSVRKLRSPMTKEDRKNFLNSFRSFIIPAVISYAIFTIVRDFCEDFSNELWIETGYQNNAGIFVFTSSIMSIIVLIVIGSFFLIKKNSKAFKMTHFLIIGGISVSLISTLLHHFQLISPVVWMIIATTGLYLSYLPFNCLYFERFLSTYSIKGNVGFVMYIADAFGYLGTVLVLLIKEFIQIKYSWVNFFSFLFITSAIIGVGLMFYTFYLHYNKIKKYSYE